RTGVAFGALRCAAFFVLVFVRVPRIVTIRFRYASTSRECAGDVVQQHRMRAARNCRLQLLFNGRP
ncbi:MAG: hypothetical protein ACRECA_09870, partial [Pseudolabrys sp.]